MIQAGMNPAVAQQLALQKQLMTQMATQQNVASAATPLEQIGPTNRIYVGSVFWDLTAEHLKSVFEAFGKVVSAELIPNPETGKHKGYGFVEFEDVKSAEDAIENMNGFELCGRPLKVRDPAVYLCLIIMLTTNLF